MYEVFMMQYDIALFASPNLYLKYDYSMQAGAWVKYMLSHRSTTGASVYPVQSTI